MNILNTVKLYNVEEQIVTAFKMFDLPPDFPYDLFKKCL